jgi:hypothetical protein
VTASELSRLLSRIDDVQRAVGDQRVNAWGDVVLADFLGEVRDALTEQAEEIAELEAELEAV